MTTNQIIQELSVGNNLRNLTNKQAYDYARVLQKTANKRLKVLSNRTPNRRTGLSNAEYYSPAKDFLIKNRIVNISDGIPKFNVNKSMTRNQLISTLSNMERFLTSSTSTLSGIKELNKSTIKRLGIKGRVSQREQVSFLDRYWRTYDEFKRQHWSLIHNFGSDDVQKTLSNIMTDVKNLSTDEYLDELKERLDLLYENMVEETWSNQDSSVSF